MTDQPIEIPKFIRRLMPNATDDELLEATNNFKAYLAVVIRLSDEVSRKTTAPDSQSDPKCGRVLNERI